MIRTKDQLFDHIARDLIWRRKELTELRSLVMEQEDGLRSKVLIRSAVALLYAHWEGFVKKSSGFYLEYVASQRLTYDQLSSNFVGLAIRAKINAVADSEKISSGTELADLFCNKLDKRSKLPFRKGVDTKSNLSSKVLVDIIDSLGLEKTHFETKFRYIDASLVDPRNYIAHGESLDISQQDYIELHNEVLALIESYRSELENSSVLNKFKKAV